MFFILSKIFMLLLSPVFGVFILLLISLFIKNSKKSRCMLIISVIVFYFFSNSFIAGQVMSIWEMPITKTEDIADAYDVGIVLGGGMVTIDTDYDRLTFRYNTDRIMQAIKLYKTNKIKKILLSGGSGSIIYNNMLESVLLKRYLVTIGIPQNDILIDSISKNTRENAVESAKILKDKFPDKKYLLITSAVHMRRAMACFKKENISAIPYCTDKCVGKKRYDFAHLFVPNLGSFAYWNKIIHEITGYAVYDMIGYI